MIRGILWRKSLIRPNPERPGSAPLAVGAAVIERQTGRTLGRVTAINPDTVMAVFEPPLTLGPRVVLGAQRADKGRQIQGGALVALEIVAGDEQGGEAGYLPPERNAVRSRVDVGLIGSSHN